MEPTLLTLHCTSLTEDSTVKAADKQRIKGYFVRWHNSKMVFGCALFRDLLKPAATLSKVLQDDQLTIFWRITPIGIKIDYAGPAEARHLACSCAVNSL